MFTQEECLTSVSLETQMLVRLFFSLVLCLHASPTVLQVHSEFHTRCLWAEAPSLVLAPWCVQGEVCMVKMIVVRHSVPVTMVKPHELQSPHDILIFS